jgi:hypothetical protein
MDQVGSEHLVRVLDPARYAKSHLAAAFAEGGFEGLVWNYGQHDASRDG